MHPFSVRQLILSSSPQVRESNLGLWIRPRRGFQPRTQASSRYPSYQRRLGTECDRVRGEFPDKLDRWRHFRNRRGRLGTRLRGFQIKGPVFRILYHGTWNPDPIVRGIPDSRSCFPDFKARDSWFHSKNLMQSGFQKQKCPGFPRGRVGSKTSHSLFVQSSHEREVCHRAP